MDFHINIKKKSFINPHDKTSIEVLKNIKIATYEINMKRILKKEGTAVGLANGLLSADGKIIYRAENLKVGLFKSWEE